MANWNLGGAYSIPKPNPLWSLNPQSLLQKYVIAKLVHLGFAAGFSHTVVYHYASVKASSAIVLHF